MFDSPVKTPKDIKEAIDLGLHMNLDNELEVMICVVKIELNSDCR